MAGSDFYQLCDSFCLFTIRSVNCNVKLLQYSKMVILSKYYESSQMRIIEVIQKVTLAQVFSCQFYEFSKNTFFTVLVQLLLLLFEGLI